MNTPRAIRPRRNRIPRPMEAPSERESLRESIAQATKGLDIFGSDDEGLARDRETPVSQLRRRSFDPSKDRTGTMTLVDNNGVLRWEHASAVSSYAQGRRRRRAGAQAGGGVVVEQLRFEQLERSDVGKFLGKLDRKLNTRLQDKAEQNLLALRRDLKLGDPVAPAAAGRVLILVHGTFSNSKHLLGEFTSSEAGRRLLGWAQGRYDQVLLFDHPTLQVSPVMNAVDLDRLLRGSEARVDLVCHSRGGLVARWWAEALTHDLGRVGRVVMVGSPLAGTSLAAAPKLRRTLELLTNVFNVLKTGSELAEAAAPMLVAVTGLLKVLSSATKAVARTPLVDAGMAIVPGLVGMSRTGDNPELLRLRAGRPPSERYYAVLSDFEPEEVGWRFWHYFTNKPGQRLIDYGADLIFQGANDLIVDTRSMCDLRDVLDRPDIAKSHVCDFGTSRVVHHLNYFRQPETLAFLERTLESD